jgi:hypothetical protein
VAKFDPQIDELYALPLDEFTQARNALAKTLSGNARKDIASLVKPSLAMWVVNQLYWRDPPTYKALVDASEKLRAAHRAALSGRHTDTAKPGDLHRTTLEKAFGKAVAIAGKQAVSLTDAARDAVRRTLAALPTDEAPGRLTREPPAVGFSLLTGIKPRPVDVRDARHETAGKHQAEKKPDPRQQKLEEKQRKAAEAKAQKEAERARRENEKRERAIQKAEQALREAERRLAKLKG